MSSGGAKFKDQSYVPSEEASTFLKDCLMDVGTTEWVYHGNRKVSNPAVERWITKVDGSHKSAIDTPWCAYWIGAKLLEHGYTCTKSGMARSYLKWGEKVETPDDWKEGDIVVFWRGKKDDSITGHVAILLKREGDTVHCLGANQGDMVSIQTFPTNKILGVRRHRSWHKSRTIRSAVAGAVTQVVEKVTDVVVPSQEAVGVFVTNVEKAQGPLESLASWKPQIKFVLGGLTILCILLTIWYRLDDRKGGRN